MKRWILNTIYNRVPRPIRSGLVLALLVSLAMTVTAYAQTGGGYDLSWSTIDNGGAISTGEGYALGGAMGQSDAGTLSGGDFELSGGFWRIKVQYPTAARLVSLIAHTPEFTWIALAILVLVLVEIRRRKKFILSRQG